MLDEDLDDLNCLALAGDGELAVGEESYVRIYDLRTGECRRRLASLLMPPGVLSVAATPSGRLVAGADRGRT